MINELVLILIEQKIHEQDPPVDEIPFNVLKNMESLKVYLEKKSIQLSNENIEQLSRPNTVIQLNNFIHKFTIVSKEVQ